MSENAKQVLREKLSGIPDVQVLSKRDAEKLLLDAVGALRKLGMRAQAKQIAEGFPDAGLDTHGDLRSADAQFFQEDCGMKKLGAVALVKIVAESLHVVDGSSNSDTITNPTAALQGQSEAQGSQVMIMAQTMASVLVRGQEEGSQGAAGASREGSQGSSACSGAAGGGSKPSVKVTKVWLEKVQTVLKDYKGLEKPVAGMLRDPRGSTREAVEQGVAGPMGTAFDHDIVRACIHDVYDDMGGGEEDNVGVLLHNTWQAAIGKENKAAAKDFTAPMGLEAAKATDSAGPLAGHKRWEEALLEVRS